MTVLVHAGLHASANLCVFVGLWWSTIDSIRLIPLLGLWIGGVHLHGNSALSMLLPLQLRDRKKITMEKGISKMYTHTHTGGKMSTECMLLNVVEYRWSCPEESVRLQLDCVLSMLGNLVMVSVFIMYLNSIFVPKRDEEHLSRAQYSLNVSDLKHLKLNRGSPIKQMTQKLHLFVVKDEQLSNICVWQKYVNPRLS